MPQANRVPQRWVRRLGCSGRPLTALGESPRPPLTCLLWKAQVAVEMRLAVRGQAGPVAATRMTTVTSQRRRIHGQSEGALLRCSALLMGFKA